MTPTALPAPASPQLVTPTPMIVLALQHRYRRLLDLALVTEAGRDVYVCLGSDRSDRIERLLEIADDRWHHIRQHDRGGDQLWLYEFGFWGRRVVVFTWIYPTTAEDAEPPAGTVMAEVRT